MRRFKVDYEYNDYNNMENVLKKYPNYMGPDTLTCTTADISIFLDRKLVKIPFSNPHKGDYSYSDWLWEFCYCMALSVLETFKGKENRVASSDAYLEFFLKKTGETINVKFVVAGTKVIFDINLPFRDFAGEILRTIDRFTKDVLQINSRLVEDTQFSQILDVKKKISGILEEMK